MPGMNGYEVCRSIRKHERTQDTPVIFLTAKGLLMDMALRLRPAGRSSATPAGGGTEVAVATGAGATAIPRKGDWTRPTRTNARPAAQEVRHRERWGDFIDK